MKLGRQRDHCAEFLFPLMLFFLFAFLSIELVLFAGKGYRGILEKKSINNEAGTCISYIREKIHQNDSDGGVEIADLNGTSVLVLKKIINGNLYLTYVYGYKGEIRELFIKENTVVSLDSGAAIMKVSDFKISQPGKRLFYITCTDAGGNTADSYICVRSR